MYVRSTTPRRNTLAEDKALQAHALYGLTPDDIDLPAHELEAIEAAHSSTTPLVHMQVLEIKADDLVRLFKIGLPLVAHFDGMPPDARAVSVTASADGQTMSLLVWSSTFEATPLTFDSLPHLNLRVSCTRTSAKGSV